MNKNEFLYFLKEMIRANPDWVADSYYALQAGIKERLDDEMTYSTDVEIGFAALLDKRKDAVLIRKALLSLRRLGKTKWQKEMLKKYPKS